MTRRITLRILALALILAVGALGVHTAAHWHTGAPDDQQCQACHIGHAAIPQPAAQGTELAPVLVARFSASESSWPDFEAVRTLSVPRAPPA
jgi:Flp pilus assembly protein CpaB